MKELTDSKSESSDNPCGGKQFFKKRETRKSPRKETISQVNILEE